MKSKYLIAATIISLISGFVLLGIEGKNRTSDTETPDSSEQILGNPSIITSRQSLLPTVLHRPGLSAKKSISRASASVPIAPKARKVAFTREKKLNTPVDQYLTEIAGDYAFSDNIRAMPKHKFQGNSKEVLHEHMGYVIVANSDPANLIVVKDEKTGRLGLFTKKLTVIANDLNSLKNELENLGQIYSVFPGNVLVVHVENDFVHAKYILDKIRAFQSTKQATIDISFQRVISN